MKKNIFLIVLGLCLNLKTWAIAASSNSIVIELGEDYTLKGNTTKIWIENSKVLSATSGAGGVLLKTASIGQSLIRQNNRLIKVSVVPTGSKKTFEDWQRLSQKFVGVTTEFCDDVVCLKGRLYRIEDYKKIIKMIEENESSLYMALTLDDSLKTQLNLWFENRLRESGLTPLKIVFGQPWRLNYSAKESSTDYKNATRKFGVLALENKQKIDIADNIRVEVKITEVRKDFGQNLGIRWPEQYAAQIVGNKLAVDSALPAFLNAQEHQGNIKILASPVLICRSGKEAEFFAGGEFPIKVLNFKFQDIVWKKYGIILKLKPTIDAIGQMSLGIESEISSIDGSRSVDGIPGLFTNRVSSYFDLIESKTIALSGLIKNETSQNVDGLPFLSRLPILGTLFSSKEFKENKTELVIFVTPQLMKAE